MIHLYTASTPNGHKVSCTLEALEMPYEFHSVNLGEGDQKKPDFLKISPNGRIPAIVDTDNDLSIFESGAIMLYLADKAGKLIPEDVVGRAKVTEWLMFQMGGIGPMMGQANVFFRYFPEKLQPAIDRYQNESRRLFEVLNTQLSKNEWVAGDYSIADIANWCWVRTHNWSGVSLDGLTHLEKWKDRMYDQPGMLKGTKIPVDRDSLLKDEIIDFKGKLKEEYKNYILMMRGPFLNTEYLGFFMESNKNIIKSDLLRKAINIGFDKEKMIRYLRNGIGIPANGGFIPFGLPGYSKKKYNEYNPEKAKEMVNEYKNIYNEVPSIKLTTTNNYLVFCEFIQKELEKIGVEIIVDVIPGSALKQAKANGKLDFFRASWIADYPDAENYLSLFYSNNFSPNGPNYTHFYDKTFDKLYEESLKENKQEIKEVLYKKMDSIVISKSIVVPLFYDEVSRFVSRKVKGMKINPTNLLDLRTVRKN